MGGVRGRGPSAGLIWPQNHDPKLGPGSSTPLTEGEERCRGRRRNRAGVASPTVLEPRAHCYGPAYAMLLLFAKSRCVAVFSLGGALCGFPRAFGGLQKYSCAQHRNTQALLSSFAVFLPPTFSRTNRDGCGSVRSAGWPGFGPGRRLRGPCSRCALAACQGDSDFPRRNVRCSTRPAAGRLCPR